MTFDDIETAVGKHLALMQDCPSIAWPNKDYSGTTPYIEFRHAPTDRVDETVSGGYPRQIGLFLLTVVVERDKFTGPANAIAQDIADRFPKAQRIIAADGTVLINTPSSLGTGFQDGSFWRQPVRVSYITESTVGGFTGTVIEGSRIAPNEYTGWAAYVHTGASQSLVADTDTALINDAGSKIESQQPADVLALYDGSVITGRQGDSIMVGVEFTFTPSDGTASMLSVCIDIGGAIGKLYVEEFPITNGASVPHKISYHPPAYTLDTWPANGGTVTIRSDGPGSVTAVRYVIHRLHKAR